ncbi:MAG: hypothetical protein ABL962_14630 [Fimbriimonadaceae bacterium]
MHYVYINNIGFYIRSVRERGISSPCAGVYRDAQVLDISPELQARGVTRRMSFQEAKIIAPEATWIKWVESDFAHCQEKWLMGLSEFSDCIEPEDQHSAYIDLSCHPIPHLIYPLLDADKFGYGSSKWIAKALCESGLSCVSDLPASFMYPVSASARERLIMLGYPTLHHIAQIPLVVLQGQFPDEALTIFRAAKGGIHQSVECIYPRDAVRARFKFDEPADDQLLWDVALKRIARAMGERLVGEDLQADRVRMTILVADDMRIEAERVFSKPMQSPASLIPSLRLMLSDLSGRSEHPPHEIRVSLLDVTTSKRKQLELQGFAAALPATAMDRVRSVFGDSSIQVASKVSEPRRKAVLKAWQHATGWM